MRVLILLMMIALGVAKVGYSQTVTIGKQVWMTKNLNVDKFRNGEPIQQTHNAEEWKQANENKEPAWCYFNNDPSNEAKYGKLYNWFAVNDPRGLAPVGYHIASDDEWTAIDLFLGYNSGKKMKSTSGWKDNGNGGNDSKFSGLPGGMCNNNGTFSEAGFIGAWWSSTEFNSRMAMGSNLNCNNNNVGGGDYMKIIGMSVRCIKD